MGAGLGLRIDDVDAQRYRREYVDDIFRTLTAEGVEWTVGPRSTEDFELRWSQRQRTQSYRSALQELIDQDLVYSCTCSRTQVTAIPTGGCPGGCRDACRPSTLGDTADSSVRLRVLQGETVSVSGTPIDVSLAVGDPVIWRRDDVPAYHLVSVVEDAQWGVTHIVRGEDLLPSSAVQILLARYLGLTSVLTAHYVHHPLVLGPDGRKLSKSTLASRGGSR